MCGRVERGVIPRTYRSVSSPGDDERRCQEREEPPHTELGPSPAALNRRHGRRGAPARPCWIGAYSCASAARSRREAKPKASYLGDYFARLGPAWVAGPAEGGRRSASLVSEWKARFALGGTSGVARVAEFCEVVRCACAECQDGARTAIFSPGGG